MSNAARNEPLIPRRKSEPMPLWVKHCIGFLTILAILFIAIMVGDWLVVGIPQLRSDNGTPISASYAPTDSSFLAASVTDCNTCFAAEYLLHNSKLSYNKDSLHQQCLAIEKDQYIQPRQFVDILLQYHLDAGFFQGNIERLKQDICQGYLVVAIIKQNIKSYRVYYAPVVGYDNDYLYILESDTNKRDEHHPCYNRRISYNEFKQLWNTNTLWTPTYNNTYLRVNLSQANE